MKKLNSDILKKSLFLYIGVAVFALVVLLFFSAYIVQTEILPSAGCSRPIQYIEYVFMLSILLTYIWFVHKRITHYQKSVDAMYNNYLSELYERETYLQTVFDVTPNIMIITDGQEIDKINPAMLKFFAYEDSESFKKEHKCICDFFVQTEEYLGTKVEELTWLEYILSQEDKVHKVCMQKEGKNYYFSVNAHKLFKDNSKQSVVVFTDITEIHKLELKLRSSQHQFELFMSHIPALVFIQDSQRRLIYANDQMHAFFNHKDIIGLQISELLLEEDKNKTEKFRQLILENTRVDVVEKFTNYNQETRTYRIMGFLIEEQGTQKIAAVMTDITNEYKAQKEIIKLKSAINKSPISMMITNVDGTIEYVNPNYEKVSGYSQEELLGKNPRIVKSEDANPEDFKEMWEHISRGEMWISDMKNRAKDGSVFWENTTIVPSFNDSNEIDGYIAFKFEINDKIALKEELKHKDEIMIAQSRHAAMGEMISMIAHQWRQPVSVIAMYANNILVDIELEELDLEKLRQDIEDILNQTQHLSKTIDDFRNFFRPNKSKDRVLASDVFKETLDIVGKSLENNDIEVVNQFEDTTYIEIFSRELLQVYLNILKNAKEALLEHTKQERKIINKIYETQEAVIIEICDNGGGIPNGVFDRIFEPYFSTKDEKNGTGLGLYMSKIIVEKHLLGELCAYNIEGGVCFKITLEK